MQGPPFSIMPSKFLIRISPIFDPISSRITSKIPILQQNLDKAEIKISSREYLSMSIASTLFTFIILAFLGILIGTKGFTTIDLSGPPTGYVTANLTQLNTAFGILLVVFVVSFFLFFQQLMYPRLKSYEKIKKIDKNLLPALQHILIQLNSGAPLFDAIVSVSSGDYGAVSDEFRLAIRKIHAGKNQITALDEVAEKNPSPYFKSALWQITTGMRTGSNITKVLKNTIDDLSEEQVIQIQRYGGQLNPLAMFYMMVAVIIPSLGVTFIMILSAMAGISGNLTKFIFLGLLVLVLFFQIMFLGVIKSRRPNLLE